jgi:hypothetical protein
MDHFLELLGWDEDKGLEEGVVEHDSFERRRALASLKQATQQESVARIGPSYRSCPMVVSRMSFKVSIQQLIFEISRK